MVNGLSLTWLPQLGHGISLPNADEGMSDQVPQFGQSMANDARFQGSQREEKRQRQAVSSGAPTPTFSMRRK